MKYKILILSLFFSFIGFNFALAGFGISPPQVYNDTLLSGSYYEQDISISRSDPTEDLILEVIPDAPEIESWLSFNPGTEFILPKGQTQTWLKVKVNVPENTLPGDYSGYLRLRTKASSGSQEGDTVSVFLGARIDVNLTVVSKNFIGFDIRSIDIPRVLEGNPISVNIKLKNLGNTLSTLDKVHLDVFANNGTTLLESGDDIDLSLIDPFKTETIVAEFPTLLKDTQHWGLIELYSEDKLIYQERVFFTIGTIFDAIKDEETITNRASVVRIIMTLVIIVSMAIIAFLVKDNFIKLTKKKNVKIKKK